MDQILMKAAEEWKMLERRTLEQRKQAEEFYDQNLMHLISSDYIERNRKSVRENVDYLVASVGTSYEPIALNIQLFAPMRVLFLYTKKTESVIEKIVKYCEISADQYEKRMVSETDPSGIYREIKRIYTIWKKPEKMYIDFTGGTKAMSAAAAMAGALINVQLVYVGTNDYLTDFRKPNPGSETLFYITNPISIFGDLELEKVYALFAEFNYSGAAEKLYYLKDSIPEPDTRQQLNFVYLLAKCYESWDTLDFVSSYEYMNRLNRELKRDRMHTEFLLMDLADRLQLQEEVLFHLKKIPEMIADKKNMQILKSTSIIHSLMFTMLLNGKTREEQEKFDMATLLFYRLLEMIEQRRLSRYNFYPSKMEYMTFEPDKKRNPEFEGKSKEECLSILKRDVYAIKRSLFGNTSNYLPEQISLLDGFIILAALHDPIVYESDEEAIRELRKIRSMVYLRNNSIFAHGLGPVREADYLKFRDFVETLFRKFCKLERISFDKATSIVSWINPVSSGTSVEES